MKKFITQLTLVFFIFSQTGLRAESLTDSYTNISPKNTGGGEFIHGQNQGKILVRILIFGSVAQQGIHFVPEGTDLLFAILYAGGYTEQSRLTDITIRRRTQADLMEIDLEDYIAKGKDVPKLADGDIITVPFNWRKDIATISLITSFISSITAFTLSVIALVKR